MLPFLPPPLSLQLSDPVRRSTRAQPSLGWSSGGPRSLASTLDGIGKSTGINIGLGIGISIAIGISITGKEL